MKNKLITAVRTVGQLLLHNPTTEAFARNKYRKEVDELSPKACRFCHMGAIRVVSDRLNVDYVHLDKECDKALGFVGGPSSWDLSSKKDRREWALKLANYTGDSQ